MESHDRVLFVRLNKFHVLHDHTTQVHYTYADHGAADRDMRAPITGHLIDVPAQPHALTYWAPALNLDRSEQASQTHAHMVLK